MARPLGSLAVGVIAEIAARGPLAARELAAVLGASLRLVVKTCYHLVSTGRLRIAYKQRFPAAKRPLAVYTSKDATPASVGGFDLFQVWR
jgi:hypothetical protein